MFRWIRVKVIVQVDTFKGYCSEGQRVQVCAQVNTCSGLCSGGHVFRFVFRGHVIRFVLRWTHVRVCVPGTRV